MPRHPHGVTSLAFSLPPEDSMDLSTVTRITAARHRDDLRALGPHVAPLAGGSELFAAPRADLTGLVDLAAFDWPDLVATPAPAGGFDLEIAATCTVAALSALPPAPGWTAHALIHQCCTSFYASFKVWNVATVGGNLATSLPAGPMTALAVALDADVLIWRGDGRDERVPAARFVTGNMSNVLGATDVIRSVHVSATALGARTAHRQIALSPLGRTGALLVGRLDTDGGFVLTVTGGTLRPVQLRYPRVPGEAALAADVAAIDCWFTDAHGAADWRRAVSALLGEEIRRELQAPPGETGPKNPADTTTEQAPA
ncbi:MAG: FAD binding domain-containing protein [Cryobacterium sp.]